MAKKILNCLCSSPEHICMLDNNERLLVLENYLHGVEKICTWLFAYCHMEFVVLGNAHALIYLLLFNLVQVIMIKLCLLITHAE